jgi:hypothetical protein
LTQVENYRKREKKRKLKLLLLLNPPPVVGIGGLGSCTLARSRFEHLLQRIVPAALGEGVQAGDICIALTKLSRVGLDGCDVLHISRNIPTNYGHALLSLGICA